MVRIAYGIAGVFLSILLAAIPAAADEPATIYDPSNQLLSSDDIEAYTAIITESSDESDVRRPTAETATIDAMEESDRTDEFAGAYPGLTTLEQFQSMVLETMQVKADPPARPAPPMRCKKHQRPCLDTTNSRYVCCSNQHGCAAHASAGQSCGGRCGAGKRPCIGADGNPNSVKCCGEKEECKKDDKNQPTCVAITTPPENGDQICSGNGKTPATCKPYENCGGGKNPCCPMDKFYDAKLDLCVPLGTIACSAPVRPAVTFPVCRFGGECCESATREMRCCTPLEKCDTAQKKCVLRDPAPAETAVPDPVDPPRCVVIVYSDDLCGPCQTLKRQLLDAGILFTEVVETVDQRPHPRVTVNCGDGEKEIDDRTPDGIRKATRRID